MYGLFDGALYRSRVHPAGVIDGRVQLFQGAGNPLEEEPDAYICIASFLVLSIQLVLWWLLYLIPEIGI